MSATPHFIIVLSNTMQPGGALNSESRRRMERGVEVLNTHPDATLVTTGWGFAWEPDLTIAQKMAEYAARLGADDRRIVESPRARDTVGDAFFFARDIAPDGPLDVTIVSGPDHVARAQTIFQALLGPRAHVDTVASSGPGTDAPAVHAASMDAFRRTFDGIPDGDLEAFEARLFSAHPFYNGEVYAADAPGVSPERTPPPET
ncbi:MAG: YdcF family protein [Rhodobacteraceae bacterium]|nr:YdcF family protein [Paracoccaceae bacterium]